MNEIQEKIVAAVDNANGSIGWVELMEALTEKEKRRVMPELRVLEGQKVIKRVLTRAADGQMIHTVDRVVAETPTEQTNPQ